MQTLWGLVMTLLVTLSWTGATQLLKSTFTGALEGALYNETGLDLGRGGGGEAAVQESAAPPSPGEEEEEEQTVAEAKGLVHIVTSPPPTPETHNSSSSVVSNRTQVRKGNSIWERDSSAPLDGKSKGGYVPDRGIRSPSSAIFTSPCAPTPFFPMYLYSVRYCLTNFLPSRFGKPLYPPTIAIFSFPRLENFLSLRPRFR